MEGKIETFVSHQIGGGSRRLIPEEGIRKYLKSLKQCPFCGGKKLVGEMVHATCHLTCQDCGFQLISLNLYHRVEIGERQKEVIVSDVLKEPIDEEVKKYEDNLHQQLINISFKAQNIAQKLELRLKHKQEAQA